jgi:predicted RNA-binding Zn-ribbon protein involved in translation (DUF1610 family)
MTDILPASPFNCPNCKALYQLVKVEAPPVMSERQLTCLSCGGPLHAREGRFVLKYFFTDRSGKAIRLSSRRLARKH